MSPGHYFDERPDVGSRRRDIVLSLPDVSFTLVTDRGVFSQGGIDPGTKLLLLRAGVPPAEGHLLDLGCGAGPIALTMAHRSPGSTVWAVDVNERAVALCAENARTAGLSNVRACLPDEVPDEVRFTAIWSNPPIRIGKAALHTLLRHWLDRLMERGVATFVVQRHLGADSLGRWLVGQGWLVERVASAQGYRVLNVRATPPAVGGSSEPGRVDLDADP